MPRPRPETITQLREFLSETTVDPSRRCFTVQRRADSAIIGSTSLYDLNLAESRTEAGWTWFDRSCWGGPYNTESKLLLFGHAFDDLGLARLALRTDDLNVRAQHALAHLGLVHEGTLRSHMRRPDGSRRDSMYYSLLADEWPAVRDALRARVVGKTVT
jgi:N-acetyltransferase